MTLGSKVFDGRFVDGPTGRLMGETTTPPLGMAGEW